MTATSNYNDIRSRVIGRERCPLAEKKTKTLGEAVGGLVASILFQFVKAWTLMLIGGALASMNEWPTAISYGTAVLVVAAVNLVTNHSVRLSGVSA